LEIAGPSEIVRTRARLRALEDLEGGDSSGVAVLSEENNLNNLEAQPTQCFLFDTCNRDVLEATVDCPLTK